MASRSFFWIIPALASINFGVLAKADEPPPGTWVFAGGAVPAIPASFEEPFHQNITKFSIGYGHALALKSNGSVVAWGADVSGETVVPAEAQSGALDVAAGYGHSAALLSTGKVIVWGSNAFGERNVPTAALSGVEVISVGISSRHTLALKNGKVIAWGANQFGQSTVPTEAQSGVEAICGFFNTSLALKENGDIIVWGHNSGGIYDVPVAAEEGVVALAGGGTHVLALKENGSVVAWGYNYFGETDVPSEALSEVVMIAAGSYQSYAVKEDGEIIQWGSNVSNGVEIPWNAHGEIVSIDAGSNIAAVLKPDGTLVEFGGSNPEQPILSKAIDVRLVGLAEKLHLGDDGNVRVSGAALSDRFTPPTGAMEDIRMVDAGYAFYATLTNSGRAYSWGYGTIGFTDIPESVSTGVIQIAAGLDHMLALKSDGTVAAWGSNNYGQTSIPTGAMSDVVAIAAGGNFSHALKDDGSVVSWGTSSTFVPYPPPIAIQGQVRKIAAGLNHAVALLEDGSVVGWGQATYGQTTVPSAAESGVRDICCGQNHSVALKIDGSVVIWGDDANDQDVIPSSAGGGVTEIFAKGNWTLMRIGEPITEASAVFAKEARLAGLLGEDSNPGSVPFKDGVKNLLKFASNLSLSAPFAGTVLPAGGRSGLPSGELVVDGSNTFWRVEFVRRRVPGLVYTPVKSAILLGYSFEPCSADPVVTPIDFDWERATILEPVDPAVDRAMFFKMKVEIESP